MCAQRYLSRVMSRGSMSSDIGCNANMYIIFVIATYVMYCLNFSIRDEILRNLLCEMCTEYLSMGYIKV